MFPEVLGVYPCQVADVIPRILYGLLVLLGIPSKQIDTLESIWSSQYRPKDFVNESSHPEQL